MRRRIWRWMGSGFVAAAAIVWTGCGDFGVIAERVLQQEITKSDGDTEEPLAEQEEQEAAAGEAAEEKREEETAGEVDTSRLLLGETIFDSSDTLLGDQYYGYDQYGRQRLMIPEPQEDTPRNILLVLSEYEDGVEKRYTYPFSGGGGYSATIIAEVMDSQGILQKYQTLRVGYNGTTDGRSPEYQTPSAVVTEQIVYEWDEETRTASGTAAGTGIAYRLEYDENGRLIKNISESEDWTREFLNDYDSEGNLCRQADYVDGECKLEYTYTYQKQGNETRVTTVMDYSGERTESESIQSFYVPEVSWEEDVTAMYGNLLGTWESQESDCYLIFTAGDLFCLASDDENGVPIPIWYGFYDASAQDSIRTDTIYHYTSSVAEEEQDWDNIDIYLEGDRLTFDEEVFVKVSE